jgi:hypothetical protein
VLDVSGSMEGEKLAQMKDAMVTIFDDISEKGSLLSNFFLVLDSQLGVSPPCYSDVLSAYYFVNLTASST